MNSNTLTTAQLNLVLAYQKLATTKATVYLDPNIATQKAVIDIMLMAAGRTEQDYPHLFNSLNTGTQIKQQTDNAPSIEVLDSVHLIDSGRTAGGKATASIWSNSSSKVLTNVGTLFVFDADSGELLAQGSNSAVKSGFLSCSTQAITAKPATKTLSVLYVGYVIDSDGSSRCFAYSNLSLATGIKNTAPVTTKLVSSKAINTTDTEDYAIECTITNPIIQHPSNKSVNIAIGRKKSPDFPIPSNTDYVYYFPPGIDNNPPLICPFTGSAPLSGIIDIASLKASMLTTNVIIKNNDGTASYVQRNLNYTTDAKLVNAFTAVGNVLSWNFPYDQLTYSETQSLVYYPSSLAKEQITYFYFAFDGIPIKNTTEPAPPFYVCSTGSTEKKSVNCTEIKPLYYWWHCVAKGTLITLEDNSTLPVEDINETYRVKTTNGKSLAVVATVLGRHSSDPAKGENEIYKLLTENGKTLIATECHMVFLSDYKCRMISHIVVGDSILTEDGISRVIECTPIKADEMFYGLLLGNPEEKKSADFPHTFASFYADGILCGDQDVMRHHSNEAYHDLEYILPRIPAHLHQDYRSALLHKQY